MQSACHCSRAALQPGLLQARTCSVLELMCKWWSSQELLVSQGMLTGRCSRVPAAWCPVQCTVRSLHAEIDIAISVCMELGRVPWTSTRALLNSAWCSCRLASQLCWPVVINTSCGIASILLVNAPEKPILRHCVKAMVHNLTVAFLSTCSPHEPWVQTSQRAGRTGTIAAASSVSSAC
jgi:hypothetical protein